MSEPTRQEPAGAAPGPARRTARLLAPLLALAAGGAVALYFMETAPHADRKPPERQAPLVDVARAQQRSDVHVRVHAMGRVTAAQQVELRPQVSGQIIELSPELIPGGLFTAGDVLMRIEPLDYELALRERESEVAAAERDLKLEMGQQLVARRDYELLGEVISDEDRELVLRQPQLEAARGRVAAARAALADARLDLERTTIRAPFNCFVREKQVDRGETVSPTTALVALVGTDAYWIEVSVPVDDLRWLRIPRRSGDLASTLRIYNEAAWGADAYRSGRVTRLAGELETEGRMARLIVTVDDPLSLEGGNGANPVLLVGSYVRVEIEGKRVPSVVALERGLLHDGSHVWVMTEEGKLDIRPVALAYRGRDEVLVSAGIESGERIVVTDLPAPIQGMPLRLREERAADVAEDASFTRDGVKPEAEDGDGSQPAS